MSDIDDGWPLLARAQIESWRSLAHSANARADKAEEALRGIIALVENARPDYALLADIRLRAISTLYPVKSDVGLQRAVSEIRAALDKPTTEDLDTAQFGQVLHDRPLDKQEGK